MQRSVIISNKYAIYELPHELPKDLRLRIFGNYERSRTTKNFILPMTMPHCKAPLSSTALFPMPTMHKRHRKKYPTKRKFATTYARNTSHEKTEPLRKRQILLGCLSISLCTLPCFNAGLLRYTTL